MKDFTVKVKTADSEFTYPAKARCAADCVAHALSKIDIDASDVQVTVSPA